MEVAYGVVGERNAKDVGEEEEDLVLGVVDGRSSNVGIDTADIFPFAWRYISNLISMFLRLLTFGSTVVHHA